ncbi:MAG: GGDEF domain-containing protein [Clostridia bacterium]|nr:GGDEF domain-containing protein [Clostridia bacterium]
MLREFLLQNWALNLILIAFTVLVKANVFLDRKTRSRIYALIASISLLSFIVFAEFYLGKTRLHDGLLAVFVAIRYSATPFIIALTLYTLTKKERIAVFIPAAIFAAAIFSSVFNGIVFSISEEGTLIRGPLGYLPYAAAGLYCCLLIFILVKECNKYITEIVPTVFLCFTFISGLILPFIIGKDYSRLFCTNIAIALFVYYDFSILQLTKKDPLTGLLNRHSFDAVIAERKKSITGIVSIDMNGLKEINDKKGHGAGDEALKTVALCIARATKTRQFAYRIGGDEFLIICRHSSLNEINRLEKCIEANLSQTPYHCAIGYSYSPDGAKPIGTMLEEADKIMYQKKETFYMLSGTAKYRM